MVDQDCTLPETNRAYLSIYLSGSVHTHTHTHKAEGARGAHWFFPFLCDDTPPPSRAAPKRAGFLGVDGWMDGKMECCP